MGFPILIRRHLYIESGPWLFARWISSNTNKEVPGWSGSIYVTGVETTTMITIGYYQVVNCPITEYKTAGEYLQFSEQATKEVGPEYIITTFDFGICMKAYPLLWNNQYQKHMMMIGAFHAVCVCKKMLGKCRAQVWAITQPNLAWYPLVHYMEYLLETLERLLLMEFLVSNYSYCKLFEKLTGNANAPHYVFFYIFLCLTCALLCLQTSRCTNK